MAEKKYDYTGNGDWHPGIPARDLTDEDWDELTPELRKVVKASAIYVVVEHKREPEEPATKKGG